jgi:hypothetical protein
MPGRVDRLRPEAVAEGVVEVLLAGVAEVGAQRVESLGEGVAHLDRERDHFRQGVLQDDDRERDGVGGVLVRLQQTRPLEVEEQGTRGGGQLGFVEAGHQPLGELLRVPVGVGVDLQAELLVPGAALVVPVDVGERVVQQPDEAAAQVGHPLGPFRDANPGLGLVAGRDQVAPDRRG